MNIIFPAINIGNDSIVIHEINVGNALSLAKMDQTKREQQLSKFLGFVLKDDLKPYLMTIQQRYYCLLQYLSLQSKNDLKSDVDVNQYLISEPTEWKDSVIVDGVSFRQLTGYEVEALELIAQDIGDWGLGAIALQMGNEELPRIMPLTDRRAIANIIQSRYETLCSFSQEKLEALYCKYEQAQAEMASLLISGYDNLGVIVFQVEEGSNKCARFQCDSTIYGFTKLLFSEMVKTSATSTA